MPFTNQWTTTFIEQFGLFDISWEQPTRQLTEDEVIAKGLDPAWAEHEKDGPAIYSIDRETVDAETWALAADAIRGWMDHLDQESDYPTAHGRSELTLELD